MEEYFKPGYKSKQLLLVGSQTIDIWDNIVFEQMQEGFFLAGLNNTNIAVVRDIDPNYISYIHSLIPSGKIINLSGVTKRAFLSTTILHNPWALHLIKQTIDSNVRLLPFAFTKHEEALAKALNINIYGSAKHNNRYGTKSGIRLLAKKAQIPTPTGYVCSTMKQIKEAIKSLTSQFDYIVIKHDVSVNGYLSKKFQTIRIHNAEQLVVSVLNRPFREYKEKIIIEGWLENCISVGTHIEIPPGANPFICAAWQQMIDADGVTYIGARPLSISKNARNSLIRHLKRLAQTLAAQGATGSFGPDFLITSPAETLADPDSAILLELNARTPFTALPLEMLLAVRGKIGSGFCTTHIHLKKHALFSDIYSHLLANRLLITAKNPRAEGVIPFHVGMLPWKSLYIAIAADSWKRTQMILQKVKTIFEAKVT